MQNRPLELAGCFRESGESSPKTADRPRHVRRASSSAETRIVCGVRSALSSFCEYSRTAASPRAPHVAANPLDDLLGRKRLAKHFDRPPPARLADDVAGGLSLRRRASNAARTSSRRVSIRSMENGGAHQSVHRARQDNLQGHCVRDLRPAEGYSRLAIAAPAVHRYRPETLPLRPAQIVDPVRNIGRIMGRVPLPQFARFFPEVSRTQPCSMVRNSRVPSKCGELTSEPPALSVNS